VELHHEPAGAHSWISLSERRRPEDESIPAAGPNPLLTNTTHESEAEPDEADSMLQAS
jgi:hypothetical protein